MKGQDRRPHFHVTAALIWKDRRVLIAKWLFAPVLAPLVRNRLIIFVLTGVAVAQVWLTAVGLPAWQCPFRSALGIPCPGCGLSTAIVFLIHGEWRAAMTTHAFAPLFLAGFALMAVVAVMPDHLHRAAVHRIEVLERSTGFVGFLLMSMVVYWLLRLPGWL